MGNVFSRYKVVSNNSFGMVIKRYLVVESKNIVSKVVVNFI